MTMSNNCAPSGGRQLRQIWGCKRLYGALMNSNHFSTSDMLPRHQFEAWCGWFDPVFDVAHPTAGTAAGFVADARVWALGSAALSRVQAPHLHVIRRESNLRRDAIDHWNITIGGVETKLTRAGNMVRIPAQTPFVISLGEVVESEREADERLQLYLPRDHFSCLAPILDHARGMPILGSAGRLLADYLRLLERSIPDLLPEDLARLATPIQAMVAACIAPAAASHEQAAMQIDITRLEQVRRAIRRRMHSVTLNAATLCRDVGMSRSQLYRLLDGEGGVARYIQRLRLQTCYTMLADVNDTRHIMAIAETCGFYDASSFSRAFRREFNTTPSDLRMGCRVGARPAPASGPEIEAQAPTLKSYLRSL